MTGGEQDRVYCVACDALEPVAVHQATDPHVPDQRLDDAVPAQPGAAPAAGALRVSDPVAPAARAWPPARSRGPGSPCRARRS